MIRAACTLVILAWITMSQSTVKPQVLVPDEETAVAIAEAVFIAQYGEERVRIHRPLLATMSGKNLWLVQLTGPAFPLTTGGGPGLLIDKRTGYLSLAPYMK